MGVLDFLRKTKLQNIEIIEGEYQSESIGNIQLPDTLTETNSFKLANSIAELYFPIDFIADRASKIRYYIADKQGNEVQNTELTRFINDINPLFGFSDLVYQYIFSILADGNSFIYRKVPDNYAKINVNSITRIDILDPTLITFTEYNKINPLTIVSFNELIKKAYYLYGIGSQSELNVNNLVVNKIDGSYRDSSLLLSRSPLFKAQKSINNLLAAYSARYNVYVNNGAAGYLVKKSTGKESAEEVINPVTRDTILADINSRNGITGRRNFWGISSTPLEFVKTLASISELLPFEETLENSIKIAGVFQIPSVLIPRKDQSTFDNMGVAERAVWENSIMSIVDLFCANYTKACTLDVAKYSVKADYSSVSVLENSKIEQSNIKADSEAKIISNKLSLYEKGIIKYNQFLEYIGEQPIEGGDKYIFDMTKVPYSTKLGVGGTQSLQMLISDHNIQPATKINTLVVVYGLTEEEANKIIGV